MCVSCVASDTFITATNILLAIIAFRFSLTSSSMKCLGLSLDNFRTNALPSIRKLDPASGDCRQTDRQTDRQIDTQRGREPGHKFSPSTAVTQWFEQRIESQRASRRTRRKGRKGEGGGTIQTKLNFATRGKFPRSESTRARYTHKTIITLLDAVLALLLRTASMATTFAVLAAQSKQRFRYVLHDGAPGSSRCSLDVSKQERCHRPKGRRSNISTQCPTKRPIWRSIAIHEASATVHSGFV